MQFIDDPNETGSVESYASFLGDFRLDQSIEIQRCAKQTDLLVPAQRLDGNATVFDRAPSPPDWTAAEFPNRAPTPESRDVYLCKTLPDRKRPNSIVH